MKNVDLVFGYLIDSPNGASSVVRLLLENNDIFKKYGINCSFYIRGNVAGVNNISITKSARSSVKSTIKQWVKSGLDKVTKIIPHLHSAYSIYNILMLPCIRIAKTYTAQESPDTTDPIFFNDLLSCYFYLKYTKAKRRPILLVLHTNGEVFNMLKLSFPDIEGSWVMKKLEEIKKFTFSRVSDFGFVAKKAMECFKRNHPEIKYSQLHYVYNGLPIIDYNTPHSNKGNGKFELCCVGSVSYRKGQDIIIESLSKLSKEELSRIHVTFLGDGKIRPELEERCKVTGIFENVTFEGNRINVNDYLLKSDIFILTSRDEGLPMSILEAERLGLPVISTKIAGIPEMIIEGETGLLINPSCDELLPILKNIDKYNWTEMGKKSKKLFDEKFTIENTIKGYSTIFKEMH